MGGGGKGGTSTQTVSIPPEVLARYNAVNARAETTAEQPFQQYGGEFVSPLTPTQQAGTQATNAAAGQAQPYYGAATALTLGGAKNVGPLTQGQIGYYQNPYTQAVVNPTVQALQQQQGQQLAEQQAQAIKGGAFGGDRAGLQRAQLQGQQNLALGQAIAPLYQQGYGQAVQTAAGQQGVVAQDLARQMQAGQQIAGLGTGAQQASLQGAQAQLAAGQIGQQTQQAQDTAQYQQFLQERGYPFQVSQFLANIAMGTGALSGSTTTSTQPGGFFSDKRLKDDVREIGETHDGQPIYSYKYKGDDRTQIGLMAQDVEKRHPEAVGLMGGYKTVDYKKATEDAERTHKDMGGGLMPQMLTPEIEAGDTTPSIEMSGMTPENADAAYNSSSPNPTSGWGPRQDAAVALRGSWRDLPASRLTNTPDDRNYGGSEAMRNAPGARYGRAMGGGLIPEGFDPNSMGGAVNPDMAGEGFERGGYVGGGLVGGDDWAQIIAANKQALGVYGGAQPISGGSPGAMGGLNIPTSMASPKLITAGAAPKQQPSGMSSAMQTGKDIAGAYKSGKEALLGSPTDKSPGLIGGGGSASGKSIFGEAADFLKDKFAYGGLVPRHAYADGGETDNEVAPYDAAETMTGEDPMKDVLASGSKKYEMLKPAGGGGGGGSSPFGDVVKGIGTVASLASLFSDERLKDNVRPVGKTFDGQNIYSYNIGEGPTQMGLMAQEVLDRKPEAVGRRGEYLTVDYDRATEDAAPYASGGLVPRQGYALQGGTDIPADYSPEADMPSPNAQEAARYSEEDLDRAARDALALQMRRESGGDPQARAKTSSAAGLYQITDPTAKGLIQRNPGLGIQYDPSVKGFAATLPREQQEALGLALSKEHVRTLSDKGFEPTPQNVSANWFLGASGGPALLKAMQADPSMPATSIAGLDAIRANQTTFFKKDGSPRSVSEVYSMLNKTGGGAPVPPGLVGAGMQPAAPSGEGKKSIGDVVTSEGFIVPALGFLGSMLASNKPNLGQALGEGIMGGVGAYQSQKKQTAELAKGVLDIVKDRFHITTDPKTGQTVYFNKATGTPISAGQYAQAVGGIADSLGVPRGILGIPTTGIDIPSINGGPTKPGEFSRPGLPLRTAEPTKVGEKPSSEKPIEKPATPELVEDIRKMGPTQLMDYARKNKDKYGLSGDRDPDVKQEEFNEYRRLAQSARLSGNTADAAAYENLAKDSQERMKQYLNDAVKLQLVNNEEIAKANVKSSSDYMGDVVTRMGTHDDARGSLVRLADIYSRYEPSRAAQVKAELGDWANQFKVDLGPNFATAPVDEAIKIATSQAISAAGSSQLGRAPKVVLENELRTVPSPTLAPGAVYSIIGRTIGQIDYANARDRAYADKGLGTEVPKFISEFTGREKPSKYISGAFAEIPVARGMKRDELDSLMKTYKFTPKQETEAASQAGAAQPREAAPAIPTINSPDEARKLPSGTVFMTPDGRRKVAP